jgi:hypothetical protein
VHWIVFGLKETRDAVAVTPKIRKVLGIGVCGSELKFTNQLVLYKLL